MNKPQYNAEMEQIMNSLPAGTPLLLHACCAPCASAVLERLAGHFDISLLFYNPNIAPETEYLRRRAAIEHLLASLPAARGVRLLEETRDFPRFAEAVRGLEDEPEGGTRCAACFDLRLEESARVAAALGIEWFCTTLSISPHKNAALLNETGEAAGTHHGVRFLPSDFKKKNGYLRSIRLSEELGLYRQSYCGCLYSMPSAQSL